MNKEVSVYEKVRELLTSGVLHSVDDLAKITNTRKTLIRQYISRLRNPEYEMETLDKVIQIECEDRVKRWGLRDSTEIYKK